MREQNGLGDLLFGRTRLRNRDLLYGRALIRNKRRKEGKKGEGGGKGEMDLWSTPPRTQLVSQFFIRRTETGRERNEGAGETKKQGRRKAEGERKKRGGKEKKGKEKR